MKDKKGGQKRGEYIGCKAGIKVGRTDECSGGGGKGLTYQGEGSRR